MIINLKLKNFRNFDSKEFSFDKNNNFIIGENGRGKTNVLEAISLIGLNSLVKINFENLVKKGTDIFYIETALENGDIIAISYDKTKNKKTYFFNSKVVSRSKLIQNTITTVLFSPIIMNMLYLSPSLRRDFLDGVLISSFDIYSKHLKNYKTILTNRNKLLKNIREGKSDKQEIIFWDNKLIEASKIIYNYRFGIIEFLRENISDFKQYFLGKVDKLELIYKTKVNKNNIENDFKNYITKNLDRDIILGNTHIGPHIDDFEILADGINITEFASRGEVKSIILNLKLFEVNFIEKYSKKKTVLLIDDLLSELDQNHKNMLLEKLDGHQVIISSITSEKTSKNNNIYL